MNDIKKLAEVVLHPHFHKQGEDQQQKIKVIIFLTFAFEELLLTYSLNFFLSSVLSTP